MTISKLTPDAGWCGDPARGAAMGRPSRTRAEPLETGERFYLARMYLDRGGYDSGGSYWGIGTPLYRYESADGATTGTLRAATRKAAKEDVVKLYPGAAFFQ